MHVATGSVVGRPDAYRILRNGVEIPNEFAGLGIVSPHKTTDAELAAAGADQDFAVDRGWCHCLGVTSRRIGDLGLPHQAPGFGIEGNKLGIDGSHVDLVVIDGGTAIYGAAT